MFQLSCIIAIFYPCLQFTKLELYSNFVNIFMYASVFLSAGIYIVVYIHTYIYLVCFICLFILCYRLLYFIREGSSAVS